VSNFSLPYAGRQSEDGARGVNGGQRIRAARDFAGAVKDRVASYVFAAPTTSKAGAREATKAYPGRLGKMLAFAIAGHHAGLCDGARARL
jgi:hypothetical protein